MKKLCFLVSLTTRDNDYQLEQAAAAQDTARRLGTDLEILYADNDAITQSTQILKAIQVAPELRPDAIVFEPVGATALPQVARTAVSAEICWAVLNREAEYLADLRKTSRIPIFSISSDHKEIGKIQGQQFAALLPRGGSILYIQGPSENSAARDRTAGMHSALPSKIQVTALRGQWTEESAYKSISSWLRLNLALRNPPRSRLLDGPHPDCVRSPGSVAAWHATSCRNGTGARSDHTGWPRGRWMGGSPRLD
jgi:ribose transport system substrate-binding protein